MLLSATNLCRSVAGRLVVSPQSLELSRGEILAVCGPSGVGKTSLLRLIAWLDEPDEGELLLCGKGPAQCGGPSWRSRVVLVAQRPPALSGTPAQFAAAVKLFATQRGRSADDPIALAETWGLGADRWAQRWSELSVGEQQRAALAVAVARRPDLLLLDEPTSALDPEATAAIESTLKGSSAIWVTHDQQQAGRVGTRHMEISA